MANPEHLKILKKGVEHWNEWRKDNPNFQPDLIRANFYEENLHGANLSKANLFEANLDYADLSTADLRNSNLGGASLINVDLSEANLTEAYLFRANLTKANLSYADLTRAQPCLTMFFNANLNGANCNNADLRSAHLVGSNFNQTILTGASLWETQRSSWQIKRVICEWAFWDEKCEVATEYAPGEFERAFSEKPKIVLNYPQGISEVEFAMLPLVIKKLQKQHGDCSLSIKSILDEGHGATITITVEDNAGRDPEVFQEEIREITKQLDGIKKYLEIKENHTRILNKQNQSLKNELFLLTHPNHEETENLTMLFLDIKHFSRMSEEQQQVAVTTLRSIADGLIQKHDGKYTSTWGDAIVVGFGDPNSGLEFACKLIAHLKVDDLKIRIGMTFGSFCIKNDPLEGELAPQGAAMSEGARLESLAEVEEILISEVLRYHTEVDANRFNFSEVTRKVEKAFADFKVGDELTCYTVSLK